MNYIDKILKDSIYSNEILKLFFMEPVSEEELIGYQDSELEKVAKEIFQLLLDTKTEDIITIIESNMSDIKKITAANIPQFSNIDHLEVVLDIVLSNENATFEDIGYYFNKDGKVGAQRKYGENHYKLCSQLGLTSVKKPFELSFLGKAYRKLSKDDKEEIKTKLALRIPIIQSIIIDAQHKEVVISKRLGQYLSDSTALRRRSNIRVLVTRICNSVSAELKDTITNNLNWK